MRTVEYDSFGPWVLPVTSPGEVPPLYRDHPIDLERALLVLKFPRDVARRDANPTMDLYDHLVIVDDDALTILNRRPEGFGAQVIPHDTICAIGYGTELLDGWFTVHSAGPDPADASTTVTLRYVGTSLETIEVLVATLRSLYRTGSALLSESRADGARRRSALVPAIAQRDLGDKDIALVNRELALLRAEPGLRMLGFHRRLDLAARDGGRLRQIVRLVRPVVLHAAVVSGDGHEMVILHRRRWVTRGRHPEHSLAVTVLPLERIDEVTERDDPLNANVRVFAVRCRATVLELLLPAGSTSEQAVVDQLGDRLTQRPAAA